MKDLELFSCTKLNKGIKNVSEKSEIEGEKKVESHLLQIAAAVSGNYC